MEEWAAAWAEQCNWFHGFVDETPASELPQGQNLWLGGSKPSGAGQVISWHNNEIDNYDYETGTCTGVCGHYTQVRVNTFHAACHTIIMPIFEIMMRNAFI